MLDRCTRLAVAGAARDLGKRMRGEQQRVEDEGRGTAEDNKRASVLQGASSVQY